MGFCRANIRQVWGAQEIRVLRKRSLIRKQKFHAKQEAIELRRWLIDGEKMWRRRRSKNCWVPYGTEGGYNCQICTDAGF